MHTTKDARPTNELMHTMGGRPAVKDSLEHMGLDVGEKGGGGKFHKEIGPVEVGEGGGEGVTEDPHGSEFQVSTGKVLLGARQQGFIYASLGFGQIGSLKQRTKGEVGPLQDFLKEGRGMVKGDSYRVRKPM